MPTDIGHLQREKVKFECRGVPCVGWHYRGTSGACVVMAAGTGVTKEPGTDRFAAKFHEAGFSVLAFDYRHFGESEGTPRQVVRIAGQLADWRAAVTFASTLAEVDSGRIAAWGFSLAGGHVLRLASEGAVTAAIAQAPYIDGLIAGPQALRHETLGVIARFPFLAMYDVLRGLTGRSPYLVPLAGKRGDVAVLTTPDASDADRALNPDGLYSDWIQAIAARSVLPMGFYRPVRAAPRVACPIQFIVSEDDQSVLAAPAIKAAGRARRAETFRITGGHYAAFLDEHDVVVLAELDFLNRHLLGRTDS
jgi:uncharacterized protein